MGANTVTFRSGGPYMFKVHGQVYHNTSHVQAATEQSPQYVQHRIGCYMFKIDENLVHVMDCKEANEHRTLNPANENCLSVVFNTISRCLTAIMDRKIQYTASENRSVPYVWIL